MCMRALAGSLTSMGVQGPRSGSQRLPAETGVGQQQQLTGKCYLEYGEWPLHQQTADVNAGAVSQVYNQQTEGPHQRLSLKDNSSPPPSPPPPPWSLPPQHTAPQHPP
ncbi:unnamed protein product [Pleuronectes platessa]|uniref:Uncharacterized protein n=1 Tax=Pleuronectes platessa TaxID=8262 RepID=A0A9N7VDE1_PLEPL|nr:unnamed protein product [Pleuronectes platessa]